MGWLVMSMVRCIDGALLVTGPTETNLVALGRGGTSRKLAQMKSKRLKRMKRRKALEPEPTVALVVLQAFVE